MATGVLLDALLVRPLLIPALMAVAGKFDLVAWSRGTAAGERAFVDRVASLGGLTRDQARRMTQATLATFGERLTESQARRARPPSARPGWRSRCSSAREGEAFPCDEFVRRVAGRGGVPVATAREDARAVLATLTEALPETELDYVRAALSPDYRGLLGDSMTAADASPSRFEREGERAVPGV